MAFNIPPNLHPTIQAQLEALFGTLANMSTTGGSNLDTHATGNPSGTSGTTASPPGMNNSLITGSSSAPPLPSGSTFPMRPPLISQSSGTGNHAATFATSTQPMILPYQSARLRGHGAGLSSQPPPMGYPSTLSQPASHSLQPHLPTLSQAASHPSQPRLPPRQFLGFEDTRSANSQRRASAAATLPPRSALALRTARIPSSGPSSAGSRRTRGAAIQAPALPRIPGLESVLLTDPVTGVRTIKLLCKIYPLSGVSSGPVVYLHHRGSFNNMLQQRYLLHELLLPLSTPIHDMLQNLVDLLVASPFHYSFGEANENILPHEALPIILLRMLNRGISRRRTDGQIHLKDFPLLNNAETIESLLIDNRSSFVNNNISIEDQRLALFFAIKGDLAARLPDPLTPGVYRIHRCLGQHIFRQLPDDSPAVQGGAPETSGGETDSERDDPIQLPTPPADVDTAPNSPLHSDSDEDMEEVMATLAVAPARTLTSLEQTLWSSPWTSVRSNTTTIDLSEADEALFELSYGGLPGRAPLFELRGANTRELAELLLLRIGGSVDKGDFTDILSSRRDFIITAPRAYGRPSGGRFLSAGPGIEKEVVHLAFEKYRKRESQWMVPRAGGYHSVAVTHRLASAARLRSLSIFGALAGLMLVLGMAPSPLSPIFLHYVLHGFNLEAIHPNFLKEWLPELHDTISSWLAIDETVEDLSRFESHFMTYHDLQVACLRDRDAQGHKALAAQMLHRAVVGPEPASHPELQAFAKGFLLPCRSGFRLSKLASVVQGGTEAFLSLIWTSFIKGFEDLVPLLRFPDPSQATTSALEAASISFQDLFTTYLKGSGIPLEAEFEEAKPYFNPSLDLSRVDEPSFRARCFCWAATGSPTIDVISDGISVGLSWHGDNDYTIPSLQESMISEGKLSFKTCARQVKVPAPYLVKLASQSAQDGGSGMVSLQARFDHWMLSEILSAIGGHSML